ncbi:GNAT family N-acetyltransferase [Micromonospora echinospora]|uniref:GNAT family N-acetyltransferase n=1 Tax=Micromonospora echinospora TaxID=1877 RepID=UPI003796854F
MLSDVRLRDVEADDLEAYVRMRCDPAMTAHLGGPFPRDRVAAQVARDVELVAGGSSLIKMIVVDSPVTDTVAGTVTLWPHEVDGEPGAEIGWMVLPEHQGRGLGRRAVRSLLDLAALDGRWGVAHAFPAVGNVGSNAICRALGFTSLGERDWPFRGRVFRVQHWRIDLRG